MSLVTCATHRATHVTSAVLASQEIVFAQHEGAIYAGCALPLPNVWLAQALASLSIAHSKPTQGARDVALALFTALWVGWLEAPVQRPTLVTDATRDALLALAQLPTGQAATAAKSGQDTSRVAVATFTQRVIVEALLAAVAFLSVKVGLAEANAITATGDANSTIRVAITRFAFRVGKISRGTLVTLKSGETGQAGAFSRGITHLAVGALGVTLTGDAVGEAIVSWGALVAPGSSILRFAHALTRLVVADCVQSARGVAGTEFAGWVVIKADLALETLTTSVAVATLALARGVITGSAQGSRRVAVARCAVWKAVVTGSAAVAVLALVVRAAWTLATIYLTNTALSAFCVAVTRSAGRVAIVAHVAMITVRRQELGSALALA